MLESVEQARQWFELAYFLGGVILALAGILGLQQIRIMKRDMQMRSERAAAEKAIEYITRYATQYIPLDNRFFDEYSAKGLARYDGPIGNFTLESLPRGSMDAALKRFAIAFWLPALNELQAIAAAFAFGVADEKIGFRSIGRTFCATVASKYDVLCMARKEKVYPYFDGIVALYRLWAPRLSQGELEALRQDIDQRLAQLGTDRPSAKT